MRGPFLLFRLSLKRVRLLLCATGLLLAAVQVLRVRIAASVHNAGQFDLVTALLPPSVRAILGPSLASIMTFNGIVCGVYFDTGSSLRSWRWPSRWRHCPRPKLKPVSPT